MNAKQFSTLIKTQPDINARNELYADSVANTMSILTDVNLVRNLGIAMMEMGAYLYREWLLTHGMKEEDISKIEQKFMPSEVAKK